MTINFSCDNLTYINTHEWQNIRCKSCGHVHTVPLYCGNRFCEVCSRPRMLRVRMRLQDLMNKIELKRGQYFSHLVLTIRSEENVKQMFKSIVKSFKRFRGLSIFRTCAVGGCYVVEVTHSDSGWHVHLHCIIQAQYIPQSDLLASWRKIVGAGGVFIKRIPKQAILNYLTKYMTKSDLTGVLKDKAGNALRGQRLFTVWGLWHNIIKRWTKIPFECPVCGCVAWSLAHELDNDEYWRLHYQRINRYG